MVHTLAEGITAFLLKRTQPKEESEIYTYGIELIISGLLGAVLVILAGCIINMPLYSIIYLAVIIPVRMYTGGYHADSRIICNIVFVGSFICTICFTQFCLNNDLSELMWLLDVMALLIICRFAPLENHNKSLTEEEKCRYKTISIVTYIAIMSVSICLDITGRILCVGNQNMYSKMSLYINSIQILIAVLLLVGIGKERLSHEKGI